MKSEQNISSEIFATSSQIAQHFLKESQDDQSKLLWGAALTVLQSLSQIGTDSPQDQAHSSDAHGTQQSRSQGIQKSISQGLSQAAKDGLLGEFGKLITSEVADSIVQSVTTGFDITSRASAGKIDSNEFSEGMAKAIGVGLVGSIGKVAGQVLIPVPGLGAAIGSLAGTLVGQMAYHGIKFTINKLDDVELWREKCSISNKILEASQKSQQLLLMGAQVTIAQQQLLQDINTAVNQWANSKEKFNAYAASIRVMQSADKDSLKEVMNDLERIKAKLNSR